MPPGRAGPGSSQIPADAVAAAPAPATATGQTRHGAGEAEYSRPAERGRKPDGRPGRTRRWRFDSLNYFGLGQMLRPRRAGRADRSRRQRREGDSRSRAVAPPVRRPAPSTRPMPAPARRPGPERVTECRSTCPERRSGLACGQRLAAPAAKPSTRRRKGRLDSIRSRGPAGTEKVSSSTCSVHCVCKCCHVGRRSKITCDKGQGVFDQLQSGHLQIELHPFFFFGMFSTTRSEYIILLFGCSLSKKS